MQNYPRQLAMQSCVLCSFVRCGTANQMERKKYIVNNTYEDVVETVRIGKADAALINTDVASWMQNLIFVYEIKKPIPIRMLRFKPKINLEDEEETNKCVSLFKEEIVEEPVRKYYIYSKVIKIIF